MSALERTAIGPFRLEDAVDPATLGRQNWTEHLLDPVLAVECLARIELTAGEIALVRTGQSISRLPLQGAAATLTPPEIAALDAAGHLVAILRPRGPGLLGPVCNLPLPP
jgi:tRNA U55 pseudouridine synthase TruB